MSIRAPKPPSDPKLSSAQLAQAVTRLEAGPAPPCREEERGCRPEHPCPPGRPRKIVERTWYFGCEEDRDCEDPCGDGRPGGGGPGRPGGGWPGRPTRPGGTDTGRIGDGGGMTKGDINAPNGPGVFVGPRANLDLPYLFMRANPADIGARPVVNAPFWESPDIFLLAGVDPALAPPIPPALGQFAQANKPNTIYAHVWNFGNAAASEVVVEFYWVNPSLGINASTVNLIAQTFTSLGAKGSGHSHAIVKCPVAWIPSYVNGGHECLLVRVWDNPSDLPGQPTFDAAWNRHIGQRNIHVNAPTQGAPLSASPAPKAGGPALEQPILIKVGPLFGAPATVTVQRAAPNAVPWLQLHTGKRGVFPAPAPPTGTPALSPPAGPAGGFPTTGGAASHTVHGDDQHVAFTTTDDAPGPGEAHVYRISAAQDGTTFGGYTVVVLG